MEIFGSTKTMNQSGKIFWSNGGYHYVGCPPHGLIKTKTISNTVYETIESVPPLAFSKHQIAIFLKCDLDIVLLYNKLIEKCFKTNSTLYTLIRDFRIHKNRKYLK